jgi:hypothetical protein
MTPDFYVFGLTDYGLRIRRDSRALVPEPHSWVIHFFKSLILFMMCLVVIAELFFHLPAVTSFVHKPSLFLLVPKLTQHVLLGDHIP